MNTKYGIELSELGWVEMFLNSVAIACTLLGTSLHG